MKRFAITLLAALAFPAFPAESAKDATRPPINLDIGAPINGNIWRIGNPARGAVKAGDIVHKGEEIANLEAMKMENAILAPFDGQVTEVCVKLNDTVQEGQLLFVLEKVASPQSGVTRLELPQPNA